MSSLPGGLEECNDNTYQNATIYTNMAIDIFTDFLLMTIPANLLWNVRIPLRKKLMLLGIFSVTLCIVTIAVVRITTSSLVMDRKDGHTQNDSVAWLVMWSSVEMGVGRWQGFF